MEVSSSSTILVVFIIDSVVFLLPPTLSVKEVVFKSVSFKIFVDFMKVFLFEVISSEEATSLTSDEITLFDSD